MRRVNKQAGKMPAVAAVAFLAVPIFLLVAVIRMRMLSGVPPAPPDKFPSGMYRTTQNAVGAVSSDDFAQLHDCLEGHDRQCVASMSSERRIYMVAKSSWIYGEGIGHGVFKGRLRNIPPVGIDLYLPPCAFETPPPAIDSSSNCY